MTLPRGFSQKLEANTWYTKALREFESKEYEKALEYSDNALKKDPNYLKAWMLKLDIYHDLDRYEEGIKACDKILNIDSSDGKVWAMKTYLLLALGYETGNAENYSLAVECFDKVEQLVPDIRNLFEWTALKGQIFHFLGRYDEALALFEQKYEGNIPSEFLLGSHLVRADIYFNLDRFTDAITDYKAALDLKPDDADPLTNIGLSLCHLGKFEEAVTYFDKSLKKDANNVYAYNMKGYAYYEMRNFDEANRCFNKVIELDPENAYSWLSIGQYYLSNLKDYDMAIKSFKKALATRPNDADILTNIGVSLYYLSRYEEAIAHFDEALKSNSMDENVLNCKGVALYGLGNYHDALRFFDKSLELNPNYADAWNNRGNIFYNTGRFREAITCYDRVLKINYDYLEGWYNKGITNLIQMNYEEAITCFTKIIDNNHTDKDWALLGRGESYYERGRFIEALEDFKEIKDQSLEGIRHHNLGLCYYQLGMYEDANKEYHLAIDANPDVPLVYYNMAVLYSKQEKNDTAIKILESDRKSQHSIDAYKKFRTTGTAADTDWYNWWFGKGGYKMALGIALMLSIFALITTIALVSLTNSNTGLLGILSQNNSESDIPDTTDQDIAVSVALVIITGLLIAILLLPSLTKVKVGNVELETAPITSERGVELEPLISNPSSKTVRTLLKAVKPKHKPVFTPSW